MNPDIITFTSDWVAGTRAAPDDPPPLFFENIVFVDPPELLSAVAALVAATSWSGQRFAYTVPTTTHTIADDTIGRIVDVVTELPARYSSMFGCIADAALQGAVDTMYADQYLDGGEPS